MSQPVNPRVHPSGANEPRQPALPELGEPHWENLSDHSLMGCAWDGINRLRDSDLISEPRWSEMSDHLVRIAHSDYSSFKSNSRMRLVKILLHLDSYLNTVGRAILVLDMVEYALPYGALLNLLRLSLREIWGKNPPRFRKYHIRNSSHRNGGKEKVEPPSPQEVASRDNLELNYILGAVPADGGRYIPPNISRGDLHRICGVEPVNDELKKLRTRYEVYLTRLKLGYGPKKGTVAPEDPGPEIEIRSLRADVISAIYYKVVEPILEYRRNPPMEGDYLPTELLFRCKRYLNRLYSEDISELRGAIGRTESLPEGFDTVGDYLPDLSVQIRDRVSVDIESLRRSSEESDSEDEEDQEDPPETEWGISLPSDATPRDVAVEGPIRTLVELKELSLTGQSLIKEVNEVALVRDMIPDDFGSLDLKRVAGTTSLQQVSLETRTKWFVRHGLTEGETESEGEFLRFIAWEFSQVFKDIDKYLIYILPWRMVAAKACLKGKNPLPDGAKGPAKEGFLRLPPPYHGKRMNCNCSQL